MKPFNVKEYNANPSKKVITRDGKPVQILYTKARRDYPIIALVERESGKDYLFSFLPDGTMYYNKESINDLFFAPIKKEGWISLYMLVDGLTAGFVFDTKEEAEKEAKRSPHCVATTKIEWEE